MMRALEINKRTIHYAERVSESENDLGEVCPVYSEPKSLKIRVDYTGTSAKPTAYGIAPDCKVKLIADRDLGFSLNTVFWIDAPLSTPHDYVMGDKPDLTVNGVVYRLREVGVSHAD